MTISCAQPTKTGFPATPDGTFRPEASITRAEALKVFVVFLGLELDDVTKSSYYDVDVSSWYSPYIEAGKTLLPERRSIQGKIPFQPDMPITREDAIYALVTALGYDSETRFADQSVLNMFSDKTSISNNVRSYVAVAVSNELVSGRDDGTIGAQDPLTRAEFSTLLYRASYAGFNVKNEAKLHSVSIKPYGRQELTVGDSITFTAEAEYSDGSTKPYTNLNPYNADDNGVVSINKNTVKAVKEGSCDIRFNDSNLKDKSITVIVKAAAEDSNDGTGSDKDADKDSNKDSGNGSNDNNNNSGNSGADKDSDSDNDNNKNNDASGGNNFSPETALVIAVGETVTDSINFSVDETNMAKLNCRWYKIDIPTSGRLTYSCLSEDINVFVGVRSCSAENNYRVCCSSGGKMSAMQANTSSVNLLKGSYLISVYHEAQSYGSYKLTTGFESLGDGDDGWTEETAIPLKLNEEYHAEFHSAHYFNPGGYEISTKYYYADIPKDGLYAPEINSKSSDEELVYAGMKKIIPISLKPGYSKKIEFTIKPVFKEAFGVSKDSAIELQLGTPIKFDPSYSNVNTYYFKFTVPVAGQLTLRPTPPKNMDNIYKNTYFYMCDPNGEQCRTDTKLVKIKFTEESTFNMRKPGVYYMTVYYPQSGYYSELNFTLGFSANLY